MIPSLVVMLHIKPSEDILQSELFVQTKGTEAPPKTLSKSNLKCV